MHVGISGSRTTNTARLNFLKELQTKGTEAEKRSFILDNFISIIKNRHQFRSNHVPDTTVNAIIELLKSSGATDFSENAIKTKLFKLCEAKLASNQITAEDRSVINNFTRLGTATFKRNIGFLFVGGSYYNENYNNHHEANASSVYNLLQHKQHVIEKYNKYLDLLLINGYISAENLDTYKARISNSKLKFELPPNNNTISNGDTGK